MLNDVNDLSFFVVHYTTAPSIDEVFNEKNWSMAVVSYIRIIQVDLVFNYSVSQMASVICKSYVFIKKTSICGCASFIKSKIRQSKKRK